MPQKKKERKRGKFAKNDRVSVPFRGGGGGHRSGHCR